MTPIMESVEFPAFRQRRQRGAFIVSVRGDNRVQEGTSPALAGDAPWWAFNQVRAEAGGATTPPSSRAWWMPRPASVPLNTATPAATTPAAEASGSLWWMQRQPATPQPTAPETSPEPTEPVADGSTTPTADETSPATAETPATSEGTEGTADGTESTTEEASEPTEDGSEEPTDGADTEETPAEDAPAAPAEEVPWWMPQE